MSTDSRTARCRHYINNGHSDMADRNLYQRVERWWFTGLPPLSGPMRLAFYGISLAFAFYKNKSPLASIRGYRATDPHYVSYEGVIGMFGIDYIPQEFLLGLTGILLFAWICSAIGLFTRPAMIVTAIVAAFLHGTYLNVNAYNHNWYLTVYAMMALTMTRPVDEWSVDAWLRRRRGRAVPQRTPAIADTGFARQVLLMMTIGFYFAAGVSKLLVSGLEWGDGGTIAYFGDLHGKPLGRYVSQRLWICQILATTTLILEVGGIFAPFSRWWKRFWLFGLAMMHIGIWISVGPKYMENILCFALLIDWSSFRRDVSNLFRLKVKTTVGSAGYESMAQSIPAARRWLAVVCASLLVPLLAYVALAKVYWWPLTNVYMYCGHFSLENDIRMNFPLSDFEDQGKVQAIARHALDHDWPREGTEYLTFRVRLRFVDEHGDTRISGEPLGLTKRKQWVLSVLHPVILADFAEKPTGRIAFDPNDPDYPAQQHLEQCIPVFQRHARRWYREYERVELVYDMGDAHIPIASAELWPRDDEPEIRAAESADSSEQSAD